MEGKPFKDGPAYVANAAANLYNPGSGTIANIYQIHLVNTGAGTNNVKLYIGASAGSTGGTEICDKDITTLDHLDIYFPNGLPITNSDFITGVADTASEVACTIIGELEVA